MFLYFYSIQISQSSLSNILSQIRFITDFDFMHCRTNELEFLRFPLFHLDTASLRSTPPSTSFATSSPRNAISRTLPRFDFPVPRFVPPPRGSTPPAGPPPRSPSSTTSSRAPPSTLLPRGDPPPPPRPGRPFRGRFASRRRRRRRFGGQKRWSAAFSEIVIGF